MIKTICIFTIGAATKEPFAVVRAGMKEGGRERFLMRQPRAINVRIRIKATVDPRVCVYIW